MVYKQRAEQWYRRALLENDEFLKFILLFISLEVSVKLYFNSLRDIKQNDSIKDKFYDNVNQKYLAELKCELNKKKLQNMNPEGDHRWSGRLNSVDDFDGIVEFIIRARNNLFHGDKGLDEERDLFIVRYGSIILRPLVEAFIL